MLIVNTFKIFPDCYTTVTSQNLVCWLRIKMLTSVRYVIEGLIIAMQPDLGIQV